MDCRAFEARANVNIHELCHGRLWGEDSEPDARKGLSLDDAIPRSFRSGSCIIGLSRPRVYVSNVVSVRKKAEACDHPYYSTWCIV